jgi:dihydropteroate synthase
MDARSDRERRLNDLSEKLAKRNLVMGILNVTPDSFSDGGRYLDRAAALDHGRRLIAEGADLLDMGGESTRPGSDPVSPEEQIARVLPVIDAIRSESDTPISVDTQSAEVAESALRAGADIVNDISALESSPRLGEVVATQAAGLILMHKRGTPKTMQTDTHYSDLIGAIRAYLGDRVAAAVESGVPKQRIWVDPGIGFGKSAEGNLEILRRLTEIDAVGHPVVVGASRKSFLGKYLDRKVEDRLAGSLAVTCLVACAGGPRIHRVHDVRETVDALRMVEAFKG